MIIENKPLNEAYVIWQIEDLLYFKEMWQELSIAIKIYKKKIR